MSEKEKLSSWLGNEMATSVASGTSTAKTPTMEEMEATMKRLKEQALEPVMSLIQFGGIRIIPDEMGLMVPPNGYAVVVGPKLLEELQKRCPPLKVK